MASLLYLVFLFAFLPFARSDDATEKLLNDINKYRTSLNLSSFIENDNANCLANQIAKQFKDQPCTNTTGANTIPGTEEQFPNYPDLLSHCDLNTEVTQDAAIMPACVPNLDTDDLLSNFTKSQYSGSLNDSRFAGIGLADEGNWVVMVLSTDTPTGSLAPATGAGVVLNAVLYCYLVILFFALVLLL
ncbi:hypothetical protein HPP92_003137 [Vanilla planifolia]|uniref:Uncharacterized GPI-anchored protein At5g19230-like domain-containing protein n=1 Tax=Vanilla planifolia TaxID=51239 RepID=A0A835U5D8_VANPL|nr:hypothetical protein HPP92_027820 [Vanilla planifolia]KAG0503065.1 hypothetical protein HPP92_003137 [Vanilla planifolia]